MYMNNKSTSTRFQVLGRDYIPGYLKLHAAGALKPRVEKALAYLSSCSVCPRKCGVDRMNDEKGECDTGRYAHIASAFSHMGEEDCIRGKRGSGTIFFAGCNLKCVFCKNYDISHESSGLRVTPEYLAHMMIDLQEKDCHNINLVTPDHVLPQILEALLIAVEEGLRIPLVFNTSAYCSPEIIDLLDGVVDIYLPDFKFIDPVFSRAYLHASDYSEIVATNIKKMYDQVGDLTFDEHGIAVHGLLVRHLVMPGQLENTRSIMSFLAREISIHTYVNVMDQYYPCGLVCCDDYDELNRRIRPDEYESAIEMTQEAGLYRIDGFESD